MKKRPLQETVDFLHAFLGFCIDPVLLLQSPSGKCNEIHRCLINAVDSEK